jgi:hypothetical protein
VVEVVIDTIQMLETQSGKMVKRVRTDRGSEYVNHELSAFFKQKLPDLANLRVFGSKAFVQVP